MLLFLDVDCRQGTPAGLLDRPALMFREQPIDDAAPDGEVFLGSDADVRSVSGRGWLPYSPETECGGPKGMPGRQCPHNRDSNADADGDAAADLIHISIPSFRDPLCPNTLLSIFYNAVEPKAVRVWLLQQNEGGGDVDCVEKYCELATKMKGKRRGNVGRIIHHGDCPHSDQIQVRRIDAVTAAGPMYARSLLSEDMAASYSRGKLRSQDFCLSIDSHMIFGPDWDNEMIDMFRETENEYAILSTRPADVAKLEADISDRGVEVPHLCSVTFASNVVGFDFLVDLSSAHYIF